MKNYTIVALLFFSIISCGKKVENLKQEVNKLKQKVKEQDNIISTTTKTRDEVKEKYVSLTENRSENYLTRTYVKTFFNNTFYDVGKNDFINKCSQIFNLSKENTIMRTLTNNWIKSPKSIRYVLNHSKNNGKTLFDITSFSRHKENLADFFTDKTVTQIASFFIGNSIYKDSNAEGYVNNLLMAYNNMEYGDKELLGNLHDELTKEGGYYSEGCTKLFEELDRVPDNKKVFETKFIYSFWARRYHEGNLDITYKILNKLNNIILKPESNEQQKNEEENEEI